MRLICPNCGAQYEVDDTAIPAAGRDVQCSGCGHGWFQQPPRIEAGLEAGQEDAAAPEGVGPGSADQVADEAVANVARTPAAQPADAEGGDGSVVATAGGGADTPPAGHPVDGGDQVDPMPGRAGEDAPLEVPPGAAAAAGAAEAEPPLAPARRPLDDSVLSVLREEAEREARARRSESAALETQPELGLSEAARPQRPARPTQIDPPPADRSVPPVGAMPPPLPGLSPADEPGARARFPDIEEINSSLRPATDRGGAWAEGYLDDAEAGEQRRRRGFRLGFMGALALVIVLLAVYVYAPLIAQAFPAVADPVTAYAAQVDSWRMSIAQAADAALRQLTSFLTGLTA